MRKLAVLLIVLIMVVTACDKAPTVAPTEYPAPEESALNEGIMYFLAANNQDAFYIPGIAGLEAAGLDLGWKTEFVGPMDMNPAEQTKTLETLIASPNTKGILMYPVDLAAQAPMIEEAVAKGIPFVIGGGDTPSKTRNAFIGYDQTVLGNQAAEWAAKLIDCQGPVGMIFISVPVTIQRRDAFYGHIKELCPDIEVVEEVTHDGSAASAAAAIESYTVAHPELSLIWFADGGAGAQAGTWKDKQAAGTKTLMLATDMPPATLEAVKEGVFIGTVAQDTFTEEYWAVVLMDAIRRGIAVPDTNLLSALLIDKLNVDQYLTK